MNDILLILHLLGLGAGVAGAIGGNIVRMRMLGAPSEAPVLGPLQPMFGRVGQIGLGVLWITGVWMLFTAYKGGAGLGWTFYAKLLFVVGVTAGVIMLDMTARQVRAGNVAARSQLPLYGAATGIMLLLVIIFAVLTFH